MKNNQDFKGLPRELQRMHEAEIRSSLNSSSLNSSKPPREYITKTGSQKREPQNSSLMLTSKYNNRGKVDIGSPAGLTKHQLPQKVGPDLRINSINASSWQVIEAKVRRIQHRIYEASCKGKKGLVHWLQNKLITSFDARLLAVRRVTTLAKGQRTLGVDEVILRSTKAKLQLVVEDLSLDGKSQTYQSNLGNAIMEHNPGVTASPQTCAAPTKKKFRLVRFRKPRKKDKKAQKKALGIPTIQDRARQMLASLALEPEWEAKFEANSFGFRPGRSVHDAIEAIFVNLRSSGRRERTKWVFDIDLGQSFDTINHEKFIQKLATFPQMQRQINAWLKAGILNRKEDEREMREAAKTGFSFGAVISPLLSNIALHGMEDYLKDLVSYLKMPASPTNPNRRGRTAKMEALGVIRYASKVVLTHENPEILKVCIEELKGFLEERGLNFSAAASLSTISGNPKFRESTQGFTFLGFQCVQIRRQGIYRLKIYPSVKNRIDLLKKIRTLLKKNRSVSVQSLISILAPILIGWANYFKYCESSRIFSTMDHIIFRQLLHWVFRRSTRLSHRKLVESYFRKGLSFTYLGVEHKDNWVLSCPGGSRADTLRRSKGKAKGKGLGQSPNANANAKASNRRPAAKRLRLCKGKGVANANGSSKEAFLPKLSWVHTEKWVKIQGKESPYNGNFEYWIKRLSTYNSERHSKLIKKQNHVCNWCKCKFGVDSILEVDHIIPKIQGGRDQYTNLQVLHRECHLEKTKQDMAAYRRARTTPLKRQSLRAGKGGAKKAKPSVASGELRSTGAKPTPNSN